MMPRSSLLKFCALALVLSFVALGTVHAADPATETLDKAAALLKAGKSAEAITEVNKALSLNPRSAYAFDLLGIAYKNSNKPEAAFSAFNKGIELAMDQADQILTADLYFGRGETLRLMGRAAYDLAIVDLSKAAQLNPKYTHIFQVRGWTYLDLKDYDKALEDFSKTLKQNPGLTGVYENIAWAYFGKKDYAKAWENFHKTEQPGYKANQALLEALKKATGKTA